MCSRGCRRPLGYAETLEAIKDPEHERHAEIPEWPVDHHIIDIEALSSDVAALAKKGRAQAIDEAPTLNLIAALTGGLQKGDVQLVFCRSPVRRRCYKLAAAGPAPIDHQQSARTHDGELRDRKDIRGRSTEARRAKRQGKSHPILDASEP